MYEPESPLQQIDPSALGQAEQAALMIMLLDDDKAAELLAQLTPEELKIIGEKMIELGDIPPEAIAGTIDSFMARTDRFGVGIGRPNRVRNLMTKAVGAVKAENLMQRIKPEESGPSSLELARWLSPEALAPLIRDEHPQAIAVLLVQLESQIAAEVLHLLPQERQPEIVQRVATLGPVSPEALVILEELLSTRIREYHGAVPLAMGGPKEAADLINKSGKLVEKTVLTEMNKTNKVLVKQIEAEMFQFEHLYTLDAHSMGALLREIESNILIDALKGIGEDERGVFFKAMSNRAADGLRDEIASRQRLKMSDALNAQKEILAVARRLAAEGTISFGDGDDDYV